jgi:predicted glutamine amidotransferase
LFHQSNLDRHRLQGDGWGVGWFEKNSPRLVKSAKPMYRDLKAIGNVSRRIKTRALIGHVRWASNPLKLPKEELIGLRHTQPFQYHAWLFAHNGTLYIPKEVQAALGPWASHVKGRNDSEVLFYWLMKSLSPLLNKKNLSIQQLRSAVRKSFHGLDKIWDGCRKKYPLYHDAYHGVNWVLTNGKILIALSYVDPRGFDKAKALGSKAPYYQLHFKQTVDTFTLASQPLDQDTSWKPLAHGKLIWARMTPRRIDVQSLSTL